jgi:hypothetical protein
MPGLKTIWERYELRHVIDDVPLNKAFRLAHSIYRCRDGERKTALNILWEALRGLDVRLAVQDEADRYAPPKPTKVRWSAAQWLQLLIYCKSEPYEKQHEADNRVSLSEEDMIIRYIKTLISIACRRNSFHVSLGLGRLLYNYNAAETMSIYDLVFQDPDSSSRKADAYYRARKNKLINELKKRFQQFVRILQGPRGERRFQTHDDSGQFAELVRQYLNLFTPWETSCELPEQVDAWTPIQALQSEQINQTHSLIHPSCFARITESLKLDPPESRLAIPRFFLTEGQANRTPPPSDGPSQPSGLTQEETKAIRSRLVQEKKQRKRFLPRSLSVLVDGIERARLDLDQSSQIHLQLEEDTVLIEMTGHHGQDQILLATHILTFEEDDPAEDQSKTYNIVLEGGQKISLIVSTARNEAGDVTNVSVDLKYQETIPLRATALRWRQYKYLLSQPGGLKRHWYIPLLNPALAVALIALIAAGIILFIALRNSPTEPQQIAKQQLPSLLEEGRPSASNTEASPQTSSSTRRTLPTSTPKPKPSAQPSATIPPNNRSKPGITPREQSETSVKSLLDVKQVYVYSLGDEAFGQTVRQKLIDKLQASGRFVLTESSGGADTAIKGDALREGKRSDENTGREIDVGSINLELLNVSGDIIWRARKYRGTAEQIAAQFTKDLLEAIQREESRKRINQ